MSTFVVPPRGSFASDGLPVDRGVRASGSSLNIPKLWPKNIFAWVSVVENIFVEHNIISERSKFLHVISALDSGHIDRVNHVILQPNAEAPYQHLKHELIKQFMASEALRLNKLLSDTDINSTTRRPSDLLRDMRNTLNQHGQIDPMVETLLKKLLLDRLPADVRKILAASPELTLSELADRADNILQVSNPHMFAETTEGKLDAKTRVHQPPRADATQMLINDNFEQRITQLTTALNQRQNDTRGSAADNVYRSNPSYRAPQRYRHTQDHAGHTNFRQRVPFAHQATFRPAFRPAQDGRRAGSSHFNRPVAQQHNQPPVCYYHAMFGRNAYKCKEPCVYHARFAKNGQGSPPGPY
ncbi:unnamed protein product [Clavelina lepadiformis]|uniref:DUF7041 domain-containing protein n=1 Tax=Clavelina lepadiformis TaxID=159417 RepID=A0ABP0G1R2_CLALP